VRLLRRRGAPDTISVRVDQAYFRAAHRVDLLGAPPTDPDQVRELHRRAWEVVRRDVFDGSDPAAVLGSRRTAVEIEREHLRALARIYGVALD